MLIFLTNFDAVQGVFQTYYTSTLLSDSSPSTISLIGGLQLFLLYGCGPFFGKIFDAYGSTVGNPAFCSSVKALILPQILLPLGTLIVVFSTMMTSICQSNKPYQLFLSQGVLYGIGNAMMYVRTEKVIKLTLISTIVSLPLWPSLASGSKQNALSP